jgi:hypothetical protein
VQRNLKSSFLAGRSQFDVCRHACCPARCFLSECKSLIPILPSGPVTSYDALARRLRFTVPRDQILLLVISIPLDAVRSNWLANDLQQTPM